MDLVNRLSVVLKGLAAADRLVFWSDQELLSDMDDLRSALLATGVGASARACTSLEMCEEAGTGTALRPVWVALFEGVDSGGRIYIRDVQVSLKEPAEAPGVRLRQAALRLGDPERTEILRLQNRLQEQTNKALNLEAANAQYTAQWSDMQDRIAAANGQVVVLTEQLQEGRKGTARPGRCAHGFADGQPCRDCAALVRDYS